MRENSQIFRSVAGGVAPHETRVAGAKPREAAGRGPARGACIELIPFARPTRREGAGGAA